MLTKFSTVKHPRDGETVMMKLDFGAGVYSSAVVLLVCSVSLVSSAQADLSAKTEERALSSGLLLDLFSFKRRQGKTWK